MTPRTANMTMTSRGIRIGIATVPQQRIEPTADAARLQAALLNKRVNDAGHRALNYVMGFCGLFVVVGMWQGWL